MFPQFPAMSAKGSVILTWPNVYSTSTPGMFEARVMAVLLVRGSAPPMPSTWRMSGLPNARRRQSVLCFASAGRSESKKKRALLVPPLMIVHGMEDSFTTDMRISLLELFRLYVQLYSKGSSKRTAPRPKIGRPLQQQPPSTRSGFVEASPSRVVRDGE